MQLNFFTIPIPDSSGFTEELNAFLRGHRILHVQRELVNETGSVSWAICVEYLAAVPGAPSSANGTGKGKIDYREKLSPEDFTVFSALREVRKELAERDGVPVYAVFTNEQIAEMVTRRTDSPAALRKIEGVGESRVEKYGERFLSVIKSPAKGKEAVPAP